MLKNEIMNNDCPLASFLEYLEMGSKKSSFPLQNNSVAIRSLKSGTWGMDFEWRRLICTYVKV